MKDQYAIYYGQIQMIGWVGEFHQEALVTHLDKISVNNLIKRMALKLSQGLISLLWMDLIGLMKRILLRYFQLQTIATDVVTKLL